MCTESALRCHIWVPKVTSLSFRCFVCRQSKQQLEDEQKKSLYGLENTGNDPKQPHRHCRVC